MSAHENQGLSAPVPDPDADLTVPTGPADVVHASSAAYDLERDTGV